MLDCSLGFRSLSNGCSQFSILLNMITAFRNMQSSPNPHEVLRAVPGQWTELEILVIHVLLNVAHNLEQPTHMTSNLSLACCLMLCHVHACRPKPRLEVRARPNRTAESVRIDRPKGEGRCMIGMFKWKAGLEFICSHRWKPGTRISFMSAETA